MWPDKYPWVIELLGRRPAKVVARQSARCSAAAHRHIPQHSGGLKGWHWGYKVTSSAVQERRG